jgi:hypothetical protein
MIKCACGKSFDTFSEWLAHFTVGRPRPLKKHKHSHEEVVNRLALISKYDRDHRWAEATRR